ncbi:hypothetical protein [Nocardiopsis sp. CC223A]|uniref:hypothetical protein n=1 Tax=Nocardiopsis sp. CC223A TaxID=3044051 RepID=UPI00278C6B1B|nr:hypothetical protein [Nocardiopsis sp. CC223A]
MTAVIMFDRDPERNTYINSSWWFGFLERHLDTARGELRDTLDANVSVVGIHFPTMAPRERRTIAQWMIASIDADIGSSLLSGKSLEHIADIRAKVSDLLP